MPTEKKPWLFFLICFLLQTPQILSQTQLAFTGTPVRSGTDGAVNTTYTYNNIGTIGGVTIRGVIKILAKEGGASLYRIDESVGGAANAWQPIINGPYTANGSCWGIIFSVSFYDASTNAPLTLASMAANGIDIDGDGGNLREYNEPYDLNSYTVESPSNLTVTTTGSGNYHFRSPKTQYTGISVAQTNVAATWNYTNIQSMTIKIGSCCVGGYCSATGSNRQSSINFYDAVSYNVGNTILPVQFTEIKGQNKGARNILTWRVADEVNVLQYIVERSGKEEAGFVEADVIAVNNSNNYKFEEHGVKPFLYYRVKTVDKDGKHHYSRTIRITVNEASYKLNVIRTGNSRIKLEFDSDHSDTVRITLLDGAGRSLHSQQASIEAGFNSIVLDNLRLTRGIYIIHLTGGKGKVSSTKFIQE